MVYGHSVSSLMQNAKAPNAPNWFERAKLTLAQLGQTQTLAVQIFVAALAQLQTGVGPIEMRTPIA